MYVEKDNMGQVAIHDLTPFEAFLISMVANIHAHVKSLHDEDELHFLQQLSHLIESEIFIRS